MNRRISRRVQRTLAISAALVVGSAAAESANATVWDFTGASGGGWSTGSNWTNASSHLVPANGDTAILGETGTAEYVNFNQSYTGAGLAALTLNSSNVGFIALEQTAASAMIATNEFIGTSIEDNYYIQSAGTNTVNGSLVFGQTNASFTNIYTLSGLGTLTVANEIVGLDGAGSIIQSGGLHTFSDNLELGDASGSSGSYALSGGTLTTANDGEELLGTLAGSTGTFSQTGGVQTIVGGALVVGYFGNGNFGLTAGALNINATAEYVGYTGTGTFNQVGGAHNLNSGILVIGGNEDSFPQQGVGYYNLMGGTITSTGADLGELVGDDGVGLLNQSGGANNLSSGASIDVGVDAGAYGAYTLSGGTLSVIGNTSVEDIGTFGTGFFNQTNSYNSLNFGANLYVGDQPGAVGNYNLGAGGTLYNSLGSDYIGNTAVGVFTQTGGGNYIGTSLGTLYLGYATGSTGSYSLQGGTLNTAGDEVVGYGGSGSFTQSTSSGNTLNSCEDLYIGYYGGTTGSYTLLGGTLAVSGNEDDGFGGSATFVQSGGLHTVGGDLVINNEAINIASIYTLNGGTLAVTGVETIAENSLTTAGFIQTGGLHTVGGLDMATDSAGGASVANYFLFAGTLSAVGPGAYETIGDDGIGEFLQYSGLNTDAGSLFVGSASGEVTGETSYYTLKPGTLALPVLTVSGGEFIGSGTYGYFYQYGGTNNANGPGLEIGGAGFESAYSIGGGTLNAANINASYGGTLNIASGLVNSPGGTLTMTPGVSFYPGGITYLQGGELILAGLNTNGTASLFNWTGGTLEFTNGMTFDSLAGTTTTSGAFGSSLTLNSGMTLNVIGNETIGGTGGFTLTLNPGSADTATGNLTVGPAGTLIQNGGPISQVLINNGTFVFDGGAFSGEFENVGQAYINDLFAPSGGISNVGNITLATLAGSLNLGGSGITNFGQVAINGGSIVNGAVNNNGLISGWGTINSALVVNYGTITQSGGVLNVESTTIGLSNLGTINGASGLPLNLGGATVTNDGSINLDGGILTGALQLTNNADGVISGPGNISTTSFVNNGSLIVPNGTTTIGSFTNNGVIQLAGSAGNLNGGTVTNDGSIQGFGKVSDSVINNGEIQPTGGTLIVSGALTNPSSGLISITSGAELLVSSGLTSNAGLISLTGGTFDNGGHSITNNGQISGWGTFRSGGLTNAATMTLTGGTSTVNGPVLNNAGHVIDVAFQPAIFTGNVTNSGTFKITNTTVTFAGSYTGNAYNSDPSTNIFQSNVTVIPGGPMTGGAGDQYVMFGGTFTNQGTFSNLGLLTSSDPINNSGSFTQTGSLTQTANMTNTGTAVIGGVQSWGPGTVFTNSAGHSTFLTDAGSIGSAALSVSVTGGTTTFSASQDLTGLSVSGSGLVDITNTTIRVDYGTPGSDPAAAIAASLAGGFDGGKWAGTSGIVSTTAAAGGLLPILSVGYADGDNAYDLSHVSGLQANQVVIKYTLAGDANLDGQVNFNDLLIVAQNFNKTGEDWVGGNFVYNPTGLVNFNDLLIVAQNFNKILTPVGQSSDGIGGSTLSLGGQLDGSVATMPEPGAATLLVLSSAGILGRRRRKNKR